MHFVNFMKVIIQLVRSLELIKVPAARAMVIWMVGEYSTIGHIIPRMLPTVLKYLAWCFTSEALESKLQILNTAVKVGRWQALLIYLLNCLGLYQAVNKHILMLLLELKTMHLMVLILTDCFLTY